METSARAATEQPPELYLSDSAQFAQQPKSPIAGKLDRPSSAPTSLSRVAGPLRFAEAEGGAVAGDCRYKRESTRPEMKKIGWVSLILAAIEAYERQSKRGTLGPGTSANTRIHHPSTLPATCRRSEPPPLRQESILVAQIQELSIRISETKSRIRCIRVAALPNSVSQFYKQIALAARQPNGSLSLWPAFVLLLIPSAAGAGTFVGVHIVTSSIATAMCAAAVVDFVLFAILVLVMYVPSTDAILREQRSQEARRLGSIEQVSRLLNQCRIDEGALDRLEQKLREERRLAEHRRLEERRSRERQELLNSNWRALRGPEFETFLRDVYSVLGGKVEMTRQTADHGIDLIVQINGRRLAVQVKGYAGSVGNDAVMQANSGRAYHRCDEAVVVTNSFFTRHALDHAERTGCRLIDGEKIPLLIQGLIR